MTLRPKDVLKPEFREAYHKRHKDLYDRLVHVDTSLQILETITGYGFPLSRIYGPHGYFWYWVWRNFLYTCTVMLHALTSDQSKDALTLPRFKNLICGVWTLPARQQDLANHLKSSNFHEEIVTVAPKIKNMRDKVIAHREFDPTTHTPPVIPGVSLQELRSCFAAVNSLFQLLSFETVCHTSLYTPDIEGKPPVKKDIETILDLIIKESGWLNKPETDPLVWPCRARNMSHQELQEFNDWRKKFDLPPTDPALDQC